MAYALTNSAGKSVATIQDGSVDKTSTSLNLPGRNYAGYGQALNEDLIYLLENFAGINAPNKPLPGQLWYDSANKKIKVYNGNTFKTVSNLEYSSATPTNQGSGDLWINTNTNQLFFYDGIKYNLIGPLESGQKNTQVLSSIVYDLAGNVQNIVQLSLNSITIAIFSTSEFYLDSTRTPIVGWESNAKIYTGINLPSRDRYPTVQYAGVAQTAASLLVNGQQIPAERIVLNTGGQQNITTSLKVNVSPTTGTQAGIFVGTAGDLYLSANSGIGYISNVNGNTLQFGVKPAARNTVSNVLQLTDTGLIPNTSDSYDIGSNVYRLNAVYANNFYVYDDPALPAGNASFNGKVVGTSVSASSGFAGDLTGNVLNNGTKVVDNTSATTVFLGQLRGTHIGTITGNLVSSTTSGTVVDTTASVANFIGTLSGVASSANGINIGARSYAGLETTPVPGNYAYTTAVRDSSGNIYANAFKGTADSSVQLLDSTTSVGRSGSAGSWTNSGLVQSDPNTVVIRDGSGAINVSLMRGTAWNAQAVLGAVPTVAKTTATSGYPGGPNVGTLVQRDPFTADIYVHDVHCNAVLTDGGDLAEWYKSDEVYEPGTVVTLGGDSEITIATDPLTAFGVISSNPGVIINDSDSASTDAHMIALAGRIGVKVKGKINKGDRIMLSDDPGIATKWDGKNILAILGRAIYSKLQDETNIVDCAVLIR
jgi:hypothetical protein